MTLPGFSADASLYRSAATYVAFPLGGPGADAAVVQPQFRSQVRRQCGPCRNRRRTCVVFGYECTVEPGTPGSPELGIPGTPGHVSCEPEVFQEYEVRC